MSASETFFSIKEAITEMRKTYTSYAEEDMDGSVVKEMFLNNLRNVFASVNLRGRSKSSYDGMRETYEITHMMSNKPHKAFLEIGMIEENKNNIVGKFQTDKLALNERGGVDCIHNMKLIYPEPQENSNIKVQIIKDIVKMSKYEHKKIERIPKLYTLNKDMYNRFSLVETPIAEDWKLSERELSENYIPAQVQWEATKKLVKPKLLEQFILSLLEENQSVAINGLPRVGKSRLQAHLLYLGSNKKKLKFVICNAQTLHDMMSTGFNMATIFSPGTTYCLVVNEIDDILKEDLSMIKEITDGLLNRQFGFCLLFAFNEQQLSEEQMAIFGEGRAVLINILPIPVSQARLVAARLHNESNGEYKFNMEDFEKYINSLKEGEEIQLAKIYAFYKSNRIAKISEAINKLLDSVGESDATTIPEVPIIKSGKTKILLPDTNTKTRGSRG
jgi:hypothetical protein